MNGAKKRKQATGSAIVSAKRTKTLSVPHKSKKKTTRPVRVDSLRWSTAKLPDMFDDAEGFFGLEEVEGVEVIRNSGNTIEFVCCAHPAFYLAWSFLTVTRGQLFQLTMRPMQMMRMMKPTKPASATTLTLTLTLTLTTTTMTTTTSSKDSTTNRPP
jgi:hypothetical protein